MNRLIDRFRDRDTLIMIGILVFGLCLRLLGLHKGLWGDELFTLNIISQDDLWQTILAQRQDASQPLYFILLKLWSYISFDERWLRLLSVLFGLGALAIIMKWLSRYSSLAGNLAGLCLVALPIMLRYSQELRAYSLLSLIGALAFFSAAQLAAAPRRLGWHFILSLSLIAAGLTHFIGIFLVLPIGAYVLLSVVDRNKINYKWLAMSLALPLFSFLALALWYSGQIASVYDSMWMPYPDIKWILSIGRDLSGQAASMIFFRLQLSNIYAIPALYYDAFWLIIMGLWAIPVMLYGQWRSSLPLLISGLLYFLGLSLCSWFFIPVMVPRTVLLVLLPLTGFWAVQIATIRSKRIRLIEIIVLIVIVSYFSGQWIAFGAWRPIEDVRGVSKIVQASYSDDDLVIFSPAIYFRPIYFKTLPQKDVMLIPGSPKTDIDELLRAALSGRYPRKVLVVSCGNIINQEVLNKRLAVISAIKRALPRPVTVEYVGTIGDAMYLGKETKRFYSELHAHLRKEYGQPLCAMSQQGIIHGIYKIK